MLSLNEFLTVSEGVPTMNYFKDMIDDGPVKLFSCIGMGIISWLVGSFAPIWLPILILCLLITTDTFLGCSVSVSKGYMPESRRFWKMLRKLGWASATIWFANSIDTHIIVSFNAHLVEIFAGAFAGVELWSIIENLNTLYPNGPWRLLSKIIKSKGEKYLDITIDAEDLPKIKKLCKKIK